MEAPGIEPAKNGDSVEFSTNVPDELCVGAQKGDFETIEETIGETIPRITFHEIERLVGEARRVLQHQAWGNPLGPEKQSALAALGKAQELLGGREPGLADDEAKAIAAPAGTAGLVLRKAARKETITVDVLRAFAKSVHDLRLTELAAQVLSAQSGRLRLSFAVRLAEAVWAASRGGDLSVWTEEQSAGRDR